MIEDDLTYTEEVELLQGKLMVEVYETFFDFRSPRREAHYPGFLERPTEIYGA